MKNLTEIITVECSVGSHVKDCITEMITLAARRHCIFETVFNGVRLEVNGYSGLDERLEYYNKRLSEQS